MKKATTDNRPEGFEHEKAFWAEFVASERFQKNWVEAETNPELDHATRNIILSEAAGKPNVLDIGSGPVSILRGLVPDITEVDPLGEYYREIYPASKVLPIAAEEMEWEGVFDVVHIRNAFDHTQEPYKALNRMNAACRPGGIVFIQGFVNEADYEDWAGLHQWNVSAADGVLRVAGKEKKFSFAPGSVEVCETVSLKTKKEWFYFVYRKPA